MRPIVTLLTDFGTSDHYVGAMKGAILSVCPAATVVDITHEVAPYAILEASYKLAQSWYCFPPGTIHVVVVDPGVGGARLPILVEAGSHFFLAPDNGVLTMALDVAGSWTARRISAARYFRQPVSRTFHGRDVFAPIAGQLAAGIGPDALGTPVDGVRRLDACVPVRIDHARWSGRVLSVDRFGNIVTNFRCAEFGWLAERPFDLAVGNGSVSRFRATYEESGEEAAFALAGSAGYVEVSAKQASAAMRLDAVVGGTAILSIQY